MMRMYLGVWAGTESRMAVFDQGSLSMEIQRIADIKDCRIVFWWYVL